MKFSVFVVGDKIEKFYLEGIKEYEKRLSRYSKVNWHHVKNHTQLAKKLSDKTYKISITVEGKSLSSEELAEEINKLGVSGSSDLSFIIGSNNTDADQVISISYMEMGVGLKATILFEQIYRAFRILNNEPYHK